ncbi:MAG: hypothetical protein ACREBU_06600 [Nitrososphaera sp.]
MKAETTQKNVYAALFEVDSELFFRVPPVIVKAARLRDQDMFTVKLTETGFSMELKEDNDAPARRAATT